mgnify:CR=1 FL=1
MLRLRVLRLTILTTCLICVPLMARQTELDEMLDHSTEMAEAGDLEGTEDNFATASSMGFAGR